MFRGLSASRSYVGTWCNSTFISQVTSVLCNKNHLVTVCVGLCDLGCTHPMVWRSGDNFQEAGLVCPPGEAKRLISATAVNAPDCLALELLVIFPVPASSITTKVLRFLTRGRHLSLHVGLRATDFTCWDIFSTLEYAISSSHSFILIK